MIDATFQVTLAKEWFASDVEQGAQSTDDQQYHVLVVVKGTNVVHGPQPYSIVITGRDVFYSQDQGAHTCHLCVPGMTRPCDHYGYENGQGSISQQKCTNSGLWDLCKVVQCRTGYYLQGLECVNWMFKDRNARRSNSTQANRRSDLDVGTVISNHTNLSILLTSQPPNSAAPLAVVVNKTAGPFLPTSALFMLDIEFLRTQQQQAATAHHQFFVQLCNDTAATAQLLKAAPAMQLDQSLSTGRFWVFIPIAQVSLTCA